MFLVQANIKDVLDECSVVRDWIDVIKTNIIKNESFQDSNIKFYYSYGFFVPKSTKYVRLDMLFPERLELELSKIRVGATIEMGNFIMSNRLPRGFIPPIINDIVIEITKVKMMIECELFQNDEIFDSIPPLSENTSFKIIREMIGDQIEEEFDMDDILDKISKYGIDSLNQREKDFLDKKSKDV